VSDFIHSGWAIFVAGVTVVSLIACLALLIIASRRRVMAADKTADIKHYDTIIAPIITEKATVLSDLNKIVFKVPLSATKKDVKAAIEALFKVKVTSVNTILVKGKTKRFKGVAGKRSDIKKAIVTLAAGQSIDVTTGL